jgi:S1-C subfamily serine protease
MDHEDRGADPTEGSSEAEAPRQEPVASPTAEADAGAGPAETIEISQEAPVAGVHESAPTSREPDEPVLISDSPDLAALAPESPVGSEPPADVVEPEPAPSWAWSTEQAAPVPPATEAAGAPAKPRGGMRSAFVGGVAGALVGALLAGGLVIAFDDDPEATPVRTETQTTEGTARPATQVAEPGDIRSILDAARPAVVRIDVGGSGGLQGTGTGFIVDASGVIVTNAHVVEGFDSVTVHLADGDELDGEVVGSDSRLDLAVVKVDRSGLPTLELGNSDDLQVGDAVVAIGNALGLSEGSGATVTTGIISGLDRIVDVGTETLFNAIQTDAAINPGNSGGPLVDMNGRVIGINTAIASPQEANNVGFAISISSARQVIDDLRAGREPQIAFLGVTSQPLTPDAADELGVEQGAVVAEVSGGSGADDAGIQEGDVIVEIAGATVDSVEDVASEVRKHSPGDQIEVVIVRDGERQTLNVTLGERPQDS